MMGHPELLAECDINQVESLLPQDVVDDLLSKYVQTFTVSNLAFFFFFPPLFRFSATDSLLIPNDETLH